MKYAYTELYMGTGTIPNGLQPFQHSTRYPISFNTEAHQSCKMQR